MGCHFLATHSSFTLLLSHKKKVFVFPTRKVVYILTQVPDFTCSCYHSFLQISLLSSFPLLPLSTEEPHVCFHLCESPCIEESSLVSSVVATIFSFSLKASYHLSVICGGPQKFLASFLLLLSIFCG